MGAEKGGRGWGQEREKKRKHCGVECEMQKKEGRKCVMDSMKMEA